MQELNLPRYEISVKRNGERLTIFDFLRRRHVALTPEEWVRQHFVHFLVEHKGYPKGLLANEVELSVGEKNLRCDSILYDPSLKPRMIVEYKAPSVVVTQKVFQQIATYNLLLHVDYLVVSNGLTHYCVKMDYDNQNIYFLMIFRIIKISNKISSLTQTKSQAQPRPEECSASCSLLDSEGKDRFRLSSVRQR